MATSRTVEIGDKAPVFTLYNQDGEKVKLGDFNDSWVVLYFYPRDNTPGCSTEACDFTNGIKAFEKLNAVVLGVSGDSVESHKGFAKRYNLKVTLLSDPKTEVMTKYGAYGAKKLYGKETVGVIRSTFLIDPRGKVAHVWRGVKAKGHAEKVRQKLAELAG